MAKFIFLGSVVLVFHAYLGYPLSLLLASIVRRREVRRAPFSPTVTVIITAHNEERRIREKLDNTLSLEYPTEKLQIIVASDGSRDATNAIVGEFGNKRILLLDLPARRGKERAQKRAVERAGGEVLVFTDAATILDRGSLLRIVSNFADPSVGCVSGEDRLIGPDGTMTGEGLYVRYEMWLRRLESRVGTLVGLSGSFFAARREVCGDFSEELQSDFRTVLSSVRMGLRAVSDPRAIGYYRDITDRRREFDRKVRTVVRGLTVFFRNIGLLNVLRYGFFSYQYFCHKLLRWLVPAFLLTAFLSSMSLAFRSAPFAAAAAIQVLFYAFGLLGVGRERATSFLWKMPVYFITVNASIAVAWWRYLRGDRIVLWNPSER